MKKAIFLLMATTTYSSLVLAQQMGNTASPRQITLEEAVQLALKHNHLVRLAELQVEQKQDAKAAARSEYLPTIRNVSEAVRLTDTQFIGIPAGSLGSVGGSPIPASPLIINQGARTYVTSGTTLTQPVTQLLTRVKPANAAAEADLNASRADAQETQNEIALKVHEIYYQILIATAHHSATQAKLAADQDLENERIQQVKYGSALDEQLIESRAEALEVKQDLLTTELQISDFTIQLNDAMGLPVTTKLALDTKVPPVKDICQGEECVKIALASHPEVAAARAEVEKASAGVQLAKADYYPDISVFARYSYQNNVPFLARNFGTFGVQLTYDLFDGGKRHADLQESDSKLAEAKENLARVTDNVDVAVETALNRLDRTKQMVSVSEQVVALRTESRSVSAQQLVKGEALQSQTDTAVAQELDAKALLLQSQLDYIRAHDQLLQAMGLLPR